MFRLQIRKKRINGETTNPKTWLTFECHCSFDWQLLRHFFRMSIHQTQYFGKTKNLSILQLKLRMTNYQWKRAFWLSDLQNTAWKNAITLTSHHLIKKENSSNRFFSNLSFFSKNVSFTKFLPKNEWRLKTRNSFLLTEYFVKAT